MNEPKKILLVECGEGWIAYYGEDVGQMAVSRIKALGLIVEEWAEEG